MFKLIMLALSLSLPGAALAANNAANNLALSSDVFVERTIVKPNGVKAVVLQAPQKVVPGDNLVFVVKYKNVGVAPASDFSVTNPLPAAVSFTGTADGKEIVSIDGGKNWGALSELRYPLADGSVRPALMSDVTHIKWKFNQSLSVGSEGKLVFRGTVK